MICFIFILNGLGFIQQAGSSLAIDREIHRELLNELQRQEIDDWVAVLQASSRAFLGKPYQDKTLEQPGGESLVVNLRAFDCTTLMDNVLAIARQQALGEPSFDAFQAALQRIRYRDGLIRDYTSRLHYLSDWAFEAERAGLVENVTDQLGGVPRAKPIHFMTQHAHAYPQLANQEFLNRLADIEAEMNRRIYRFIPKDRVGPIESQLRDGDILAITASTNGLDVAHVGFCVQVAGRAHLLHASSDQRAVVISDEPLPEYLAQKTRFDGIMVLRPVAPKR